jgi:hypothetical protein
LLDEKLLGQVSAARSAAGVKDLVQLTYEPRQVKKFGDLLAKVGLLSSPGVAVIARDGRIENFWTTYVDTDLVTKSLRNAAKAKRCTALTGADVAVAPPTNNFSDAATLAGGGTPATGTAGAPSAPHGSGEKSLSEKLLS